MKLMLKIYEEGLALRTENSSDALTAFSAKKVLLTTDSSTSLPYYQRAVDGSEEGAFDWGIAPLPHAGRRARLLNTGSFFGIARTTEREQLASWLFVKWFGEVPQQSRWVEASHCLPLRHASVVPLGSYMGLYPRFKDALEVLERGKLIHVPPRLRTGTVDEQLMRAFDAILDGADVEDTIRRLNLIIVRITSESYSKG
jgi:ABC-type glycerol-3-phosphate transport system substrate-binding protein